MEDQNKTKSTKASREFNLPYQLFLNFIIPIVVVAAMLIFVFTLGYFL